MKRSLSLILSFALSVSALFAQELPQRPDPPRLVNDLAGMMTPGQVSELEAKLTDFERRTSTQIAVVTVDDLDGMASSDYAQRLHEQWGVGQQGRDNGILMLIKPKTDSPGEAFISVGYGLEGVIPDITAGRIMDVEMIPNFRNGDYYAGINKSVDVLMQLSEGEFTASEYIKNNDTGGNLLVNLIVPIVFMTIILLGLRRRKGGGGNDGSSGGGRWIPPVILGGGFGSRGGGFGGGFGGFGGGGAGGGGAGRSWMVALMFSVTMMTVSCSNTDDEIIIRPEQNHADRTVIVYMAGHNNLSGYMSRNIDDMAIGMKGIENGNLIVYFDSSDDKPSLIRIKPDGTKKVIAQYSEENSASPSVVRRVVSDVIRMYPADTYGLVFSSHAMGWLPASYVPGSRSMSSVMPKDSMPGVYITKWFGQDLNHKMEVDDLASSLPGNRKFDFMLFDACFMSSIEALYSLRYAADQIISSPTEVMGKGFPFKDLVPLMFDMEATTTDIARGFVDFYRSIGDGYPQSASVSVVKTSELEALALSMASVMFQYVNTPVDRESIQAYERLGNHIFFDLDDYVEKLTGGDPIVYRQFKAKLDEVVLYKESTPTVYSVYSGGGVFRVNKFSGISTYIPRDGSANNAAYYRTQWAIDIGASVLAD